MAPTHWSFGQLCSLVGAPAGYLRQLPAPLAGINLQHGLSSHRAELPPAMTDMAPPLAGLVPPVADRTALLATVRDPARQVGEWFAEPAGQT